MPPALCPLSSVSRVPCVSLQHAHDEKCKNPPQYGTDGGLKRLTFCLK
eukprot:COSAG02_NODE_1916_length_10389_cov_4.419922_5_plen_48_part_00